MKTSHALFVLMAGTVVLNLPRYSDGMTDAAEVRSERATQAQERMELTELARQYQKDSRTALEMIEAGCLRVVDSATGIPAPLTVGVLTVHEGSDRRLDPGTLICNEMGFVAVIGEGSRVERVVQVAPADMPRYQRIFQAIKSNDFSKVNPVEENQ